ncbi:retrovirus-related pol polyprotein from transposon TNT 1-94 [Tanacetum coccineum]
MIKRYVKGLSHNLFFVGQFCDADMEVAFRKSTCYIRDLKGNGLLTGTCRSDLYTIDIQESSSPTPICFLAKASPTQAWLWNRILSHLNFDTINLLSKNDIVNGLPKLKFVKDQLCSSCEMGKEKRSSLKSLTITRSKKRLDFLYMDLCSPMQIETINGKKYILVIVDDYSRGTEFLNKTLHAYFKEEGIEHQTSTPRSPKQNDVVEIRNHTLVEASRTMLSSFKLPLFFWAEAIATACSILPRLHEVEDLQGDDLLYYDAEMELTNMILLSIPNKIYKYVDSCKTAKEIWDRVERLMRGTIQSQVDRETRFINEFDQFVAEPGESLVSVYNYFAQLMNDLEQNNMKFPTILVNIKFLNSLQPEWLKYVTQVCLAKKLSVDSFDDLFDYLSQFEKLVNTSRAKKLEKSHDLWL